MYSKFLLALGAAFILFAVSMFVGYLSHSGFAGIFKVLFIRLLIVFSAVTSGISIGIFIYSLITGSEPLDTIHVLTTILREELSKVW
jgi:hypothetical protein